MMFSAHFLMLLYYLAHPMKTDYDGFYIKEICACISTEYKLSKATANTVTDYIENT